jgi:hypothetical protein
VCDPKAARPGKRTAGGASTAKLGGRDYIFPPIPAGPDPPPVDELDDTIRHLLSNVDDARRDLDPAQSAWGRRPRTAISLLAAIMTTTPD